MKRTLKRELKVLETVKMEGKWISSRWFGLRIDLAHAKCWARFSSEEIRFQRKCVCWLMYLSKSRINMSWESSKRTCGCRHNIVWTKFEWHCTEEVCRLLLESLTTYSREFGDAVFSTEEIKEAAFLARFNVCGLSCFVFGVSAWGMK